LKREDKEKGIHKLQKRGGTKSALALPKAGCVRTVRFAPEDSTPSDKNEEGNCQTRGPLC